MSLKERLINLFPKSLHLPIRYYFRKINGTLDDEIRILNKLVNGGCAIDIGANYGLYTYVLSKLCERVEAFEPIPECAETILAYSRYLAKKGKNNIYVHRVGLSNTSGYLTLHIPVRNGKRVFAYASFEYIENPYEDIQVPVFRLDDFNFRNVSFIKIDVEGHEDKVLEGAQETILREKPVILIEIEQRHMPGRSIEDVFNKIIAFGYEGSFLFRNKLTPLSEFSYEKHQQPYLNNVMCRDYINNFIFKPIR